MTPKRFVVAIVAVGSLAAETAVLGQPENILINGSFEDNNAGGTIYNMSNDVFNATVNNATAWGSGMEIDLMTFGGGIGLDPVDGDWHLGIHSRNDGTFDAFSFHLSGPIVEGTSYDLSLWAAANTSFDPGTEALEIGVSSSPDSFGTLVYSTGSLNADKWTQYVTNFVAPVGGDFLSVRITGSPDNPTWAHIDGFSLVPAPGALALLGCAGLASRRRRRN